MKKHVMTLALAAGAALLLASCAKSPGAPSVSFTSPLAAQPANGASFKFNAQPVSLTITNAVRTATVTTTYSVEVATDAGFTNKVFTKDAIPEGTGTTSVTVNSLAGGATYYWRWHALVDGVSSAPSTPLSFVVAPQIIINPPVVVDPIAGATATQARPAFVTNNATRVGPVGTISYEFQVSTSTAFTSILASATITEGSGGQTSWTPTSDLPEGALAWRVRATDPANTEVSGFSAPTAFTLQPFNMKDALILNNPANLGSWAETAKITSIDFTSDAILVEFDRRQGPNAWSEVSFGGGAIQYTLGMCLKIGAKWACSAAIQFWSGRDLEASGFPDRISADWFYDARWGIMQGHQPSQGEQVGIFVAHGNLRDSANWAQEERSNVVIMPFGGNYRPK